MAQWEEHSFTSSRGHTLWGQSYTPPGHAALLVHLHGYRGHSGVAEHKEGLELLAQLTSCAVFAYDQVGHGRSGPHDAHRRVWLESVEGELADDVYRFLEAVVHKAAPENRGLPHFISGLSLGGLVCALAALKNQAQWAGVIPLCPAWGPRMNPLLHFMRMLLPVAIRVAPGLRIVPAPRASICTPDDARAALIGADPLVDHGAVRIVTARAFLEGFHAFQAHASELTLPMLLVFSTTDKAVDPEVTRRAFGALGSRDKAVHEIAGERRHDALLIPERREVIQAMAKWIKGQLSKQRRS